MSLSPTTVRRSNSEVCSDSGIRPREVRAAFAEGDLVIAEGNFGLEDGAAVADHGEVQP